MRDYIERELMKAQSALRLAIKYAVSSKIISDKARTKLVEAVKLMSDALYDVTKALELYREARELDNEEATKIYEDSAL